MRGEKQFDQSNYLWHYIYNPAGISKTSLNDCALHVDNLLDCWFQDKIHPSICCSISPPAIERRTESLQFNNLIRAIVAMHSLFICEIYPIFNFRVNQFWWSSLEYFNEFKFVYAFCELKKKYYGVNFLLNSGEHDLKNVYWSSNGRHF